MRSSALNLILFWASLDSVFPLNFLLEKLSAAGFNWFSVLELVYASPREIIAIHLITGICIIVLGLLNRFTVPRLLMCCVVISFVIIGNRLLACTVNGNPTAFEALYVAGSFDPALCLYYGTLNLMTALIKAFYFVGTFILLRWAFNQLTGFRFMPELKPSSAPVEP